MKCYCIRPVFLLLVVALVSVSQARIGGEDVAGDRGIVDHQEKSDDGRRQLWGSTASSGGSGRYENWPSRCCGQNDNAECLCPVRRLFPDLAANVWDGKCAEQGA